MDSRILRHALYSDRAPTRGVEQDTATQVRGVQRLVANVEQ